MPTTPTSTSGASGTTTITGGAGSENLVGGSGDDILNGGGGSDTLNGGSGSDILDGGAGLDTLKGGSGADTLIYKAWENQWKIGSTVYIAPSSGSGVTTTGTSFTGYDNYDGGSGSAKVGTAERDTVQIWLNPAQLANAALMAEIAYVQNIWIPQQLNSNTGQAGQAVYQFQNINLQISAVEQITIHNQFGSLDIINPTVNVNIVDASLNDGDDQSQVTFTFSEAVNPASVNLSVSGGTLSGLVWNATNTAATATFTAAQNSETPGSVTVVSYTDVAGNAGTIGSDTVVIDTKNPTVNVNIVDASLNDGDDQSQVTFTFSEAVNPASVNLSVSGGTLSALVWNATNTSATATFTAAQNSETPGSVTVVSYTDVAGNAGTGASDSVDIDTANPTASVVIADPSLSDTDSSSLVTITFSEAVKDFSNDDVTLVGGTLSALSSLDGGVTWTATFTATDGFDGDGSVTVTGEYADLVGNIGATGATDTVDIDRANPTASVVIADPSLSDTDSSSLVTITFSEAVKDFSNDDVTLVGGTLSALSSLDGGVTWTATFTATDGFDGDGSVTVTGEYADLVGNIGATGATDTVDIDRANPTASVVIADPSLSDTDSSSLVTITFSEAVKDFSNDDVTLVGGTLSALSSLDGGVTWTATFTATDGFDGDGSVTVTGEYADLVGNIGATGATDTVDIDRANPTASVVIADPSLSDTDSSSLVTITFSEAVKDFSNDDVTLVGGTLSALSSLDGGVTWTATFTATDGFDGDGSVTVTGEYADLVGNIGATGATDTVDIDRANPTASVVIADPSLSDTDSSSLVTITFSEAVKDFSNDDVTLVGGTLSALSSLDGGVTWTATFTATDGFDGDGSVTVTGEYADLVGNIGATGATDTVDIDRANPTASVVIADPSLSDTDSSSLVTITFSEAVKDFSNDDVTLVGGTLSALSSLDGGVTWTATFTATDGFDGDGSVTVTGEYADLVGNIGATGATDTVDIDRANPTASVVIADPSLSDTDSSSLVTITFSEAVKDFSNDDVTLVGGTLSALSSLDGGVTWTATFTATDGFDGDGSVTVTGEYADLVGNIGATGATDTVDIDRANPTASVVIADPSLSDTDSSSLVTITFSEAVKDFSNDDVTLVGGTLSALSSLDGGVTWTATFTATDGFDGDGSVTVTGEYADLVGNIGATGATDTVDIDRANPTASVVIADPSLSDTDSSSLVTITFSEAVKDFSNDDVTLVGGTLSALSSLDGGVTWTATFTATDGFDGDGSVTVTGEYADLVGNIGATGATDTVDIDRANPTASVVIADPSLSDTDSSSLVTITFSEAVKDFSNDDVTLVGGTLSALSSLDGGVTWTATFTATDGFDGDGSVTVTGEYADLVGNIGATGATDTVDIDRANPTASVVIADPSLSDTDSSSLVTITFSEAVKDFSNDDVTLVGGTLSALSSLDGGVTWTATFTATDGFDGDGSVTVTGEYADLVGNIGATGATDTVDIDRANPTASVVIADPSLSDTDSSSLVTITFSEAVKDFSNDDVTLVGGTLSALSSLDGGVTWTATFTATDGFDGDGSVTVTGEYADLVGNIGATGATDTVDIDRANPTASVVIADPSLSDTDSSSLVTITFSEAVKDFSNDDVTLVGGTLSALSSLDGGVTWTATFTATDGFDGDGSVTVTGEYADLVGNIGATGATDTVDIDRANPTASVVIADPSLSDTDSSSLVTITFSEAVKDFSNDDVTLVGGTLSALSSLDGGVTWTATFTATDGFDGDGSVTVTGEYADLVGNIGATGATDTVDIDRANPTASVVIADPSLSDTDSSSLVTITFSEAVKDFSNDDVTLVGGTLSALSSLDGGVTWTATFTATDGFDGDGSVTVTGEYADLVGNIGATGATDTVDIDRANPTASVVIADPSLSDTDSSSLVTITFSEAVKDFSNDDVTLVGGTLSALSSLDGGVTWTATFTATDGFDGDGSVTVTGEYADLVGNIGATGATDTVDIDRANPTASVVIADPSLSDTDSSSLVTITFSEAVKDFSNDDVTLVGGTLSALSSLDGGVTWTATFTATDGFDGDGSVTVTGEYADLVGNIGATGATDTVDIDRANPTASVVIADPSLSDTDSSSLVTITFSEAVKDFSNDDVTLVGGTLSALSSLDGGVTWTATFTATDGFDGDGSVTVTGEYADLVGNIGATGATDTVDIDRANPTASVVIADPSLSDTDSSSLVTITFSEAVKDFSNDDVTLVGGTLSALSSLDGGVTWTATFTATDGFDGDGSVTVTGEYADLVGNIGATGATDTVDIDRANPTASVVIADPSLSDTDSSSLVTITFSEAVKDFSNDDVTLVGGTLSALSSLDGGVTWTATFTATDGFDGDGSVTVTGEYADLVGNIGATGATDTVDIDRANPTASVVIADPSLSDTDSSSLVTITFSEAVKDFSNDDVTLVGGTLSALSSLDGGVTWTATFTATDGFDGDGSVTVTGEYADLVGNIGATGATDTVDIDRANPTASVVIADPSLSDTDSSSLVTITFSEAVKDFSNDDVTLVGGTLSALSSLDGGVTWTATFTATDGFDGDGSVTVTGEYADLVGNIGATGATDTVDIDRANPTASVVIADPSLSDTDSSSLVTITFSEAVKDFSNDDVTLVGGTLSALSSLDGGVTWTATFTATDGFDGDGSVTVTGEYADLVGNIGATGATDTVDIDRANPTASVVIADPSLSDTDSSSLVTITFSEAVKDFSNDDVTLVGGTLSALSSLDGGVTWTATFTATDGFDGDGSVTVTGEYADLVGNIGATGATDTVDIDRANPTASVVIADPSLSDTDSSSLVTITFSEAVKDFSNDDVTLVGGTLSALSSLDGGVTWTATFTATDGFDGDGSVTVTGEYADLVGNIGATGATDTVDIDRANPELTIDIVDVTLSDGNNSSEISFTFSEEAVDFDEADVAVGSGLSLVAGSLVQDPINSLVWTATVTAVDGFAGTASVSVANGAYTDAAGNAGVGSSDSVTIDRLNPTINVDIMATSLSDTTSSSQVKFVFSEVPSGFTEADIHLSAGLTLVPGSLVQDSSNPLLWTATVTATDAFTGTGTVTVNAGDYTDAAGNAGGAGSDSVTIDRTNPTINVDITATALSDTTSSSQVKFVFSEVPSGFTEADIHLSAGLTLVPGSLVQDSSNPLLWTATVTATDAFTGTGTVTVNAGDYTDAAGNAGGAGSDSVTIDRTNPTANVNIVDTLLNDGDPSSSVTITFSEAVIGFSNADVTVVGGTLSALASSDGGVTWNATFTATDGIDGTGSVTVSGSYTDAAGNTGATGANDTVDIDRQESAFTADNLRFLLNTNNENEGGQSGQTIAVNADLGTFQAIGLPGTWTFSLGAPSTSFKIEGNHLITTAELQNFTTTLTINVSDGSSTIGIPVSVNIGTNGTSSISLTGGIDLGFGVGGKDTISGLAGNDSISGGSDNDTLDGGAGSDVLWGASGDDRLTGGLGSDVLTGGAGSDVFVFNVTPGSADADTITDFNATGIDHIGLVGSVFSVIGATVDSGEFRAGSGAASNAADANDYLLFDTSNGQLFYDADGNGSGARVLIATLTIAGITGGVGAVDYTDFNIL